MNQASINYAKVLYELSVSLQEIQEMERIFSEVPEIYEMFQNPVISKKAKYNVIDKVFSPAVVSFLKILIKQQNIDLIYEIFRAYKDYYDEENSILEAVIYCVDEPDGQQLEGIKEFLKKKCQKNKIKTKMVIDKSLLGGFVIKAGNMEYDWSYRGRLNRLEQKLAGR